MTVQTESYDLSGGLDLVTPYLSSPQGRARDALNLECLPEGGYARIRGYLAYDGQANPDDDEALADEVPGTGPVLGVWIYENEAYAFRDDGTSGQMYKATAAGWAIQSLGRSLRYDGADDVFEEGQTVTGGTSGATATIRRVVYSGGLIDDSSAFGLLVISNVSGAFQNNETITSSGTTALANGPDFANTLTQGGTYRFINNNFFGQDSGRRMYCAYGTGFAFEWDGTYFTPLEDGSGLFPTLIAEFKDHLFLGYPQGSIVSSSINNPTEFLALTGAAEITVGDEIVDLVKLPGGVLMIGCRSKIDMLYGNNSETWEKQPYAEHGLVAKTHGNIAGRNLVLDDRGIQEISASREYGDFRTNSLSFLYSELLRTYIQTGYRPFTVVSRERSQYRIFFKRRGFYLSFNGQNYVGAMPVELGHDVNCLCSGEDENEAEMILFGADDGYVYQMERTNFANGGVIRWRLQLAYGYQSAPTRRKQYKKTSFETAVFGENVSVRGTAIFNFGGKPGTSVLEIPILASATGAWDVDSWNEFRWFAPPGGTAEMDTEGLGNNMSVIIYGTGEEDAQINLYNATTHFIYRRLNR